MRLTYKIRNGRRIYYKVYSDGRMERTSRVEYLSRKPKSTKPSVSGEGSSSAMRKRSPTRHRSSGRRSPLGSDSHKARIGTAFGRDSPTKRRSSNRKSPSRSVL